MQHQRLRECNYFHITTLFYQALPCETLLLGIEKNTVKTVMFKKKTEEAHNFTQQTLVP